MLELKTHDEFFEFSHNSVHKLLVPKEIISQLEADFTSIGNFSRYCKGIKEGAMSDIAQTKTSALYSPIR